jgi:hypothetical protein
MERVDQALLMPGQCAVTAAGDGPFIDTLREDDRGYRIYVTEFWIREAAALMGFGSPEAVESLVQENAALRHQLAEAQQSAIEPPNLREAIRRTLSQGAVVVKREEGGGDVTEWKLRQKPGLKAPVLEED